MPSQIIIDATDGIMGRIASFAAKQSLLGKEVVIVNCNQTLITGRPRTAITNYQQKRSRGGSSLKGPHFPKSPERIMKRTVKGMLSHRQARGRDALKRVICYNKVPAEFENAEKISLKREIKVKALTLKKLSEEL
ncbi:MAG: 50S ribosomal protein L13 [Nanoarchaeota archaeon]|nr:50S ribosomal protein L13 [Nanoarchaeota archaeon]MBU1051453.1 50S ribosomal protein L13 [Nanoarchaeota archaeon]MBU1989012.1 50S ribosomal protein L13 [Nanoarchaeota archaeon]